MSDTVSWTLPDGTILMHNSMDTASVGIVPSSDSNNVGIVPVGMNSFPAGVYTCTVNNQPLLVEVGSSKLQIFKFILQSCQFFFHQISWSLRLMKGAVRSLITKC